MSTWCVRTHDLRLYTTRDRTTSQCAMLLLLFFSFLLFLFCHRATVHVCFLSIVTNKRIIHQCDEPTDGQDRLARRTLTAIVSCICRLADLSAHKLSSCYRYIVTATSNMQFATAHKCRRHSFLLIDRIRYRRIDRSIVQGDVFSYLTLRCGLVLLAVLVPKTVLVR